MTRTILWLAAALGISGCAAVPGQETAQPGDLSPISVDYRTRIASWAGRHDLGDELRGARISDPYLLRDSTGRLLWLVCLDVEPAGRAGAAPRPRLHAFGFAPNFVTAPLERAGSSLTWQVCTEQALTWRPYQDEPRRRPRRERRG